MAQFPGHEEPEFHMPNATPRQTELPRLQLLAQREARRVCRIARLPNHEADDIRQDMLLDLLPRLSAFDPSRGSIDAFASVCFRHRGSRLAEQRARERRARHEADLDQPACVPNCDATDEPLRLAETIPETEGYLAWCGHDTDAIGAVDQRLDFARACTVIDRRDYALCAALAADSAHEVARRSTMSRSTVYRRVHEIRMRLLAAGVGRFVRRAGRS